MDEDRPKQAATETDENRFRRLKRKVQRKDAGSAAANDAIDAMVKKGIEDRA
jgi:hypothetical protein